MSAEEITAVLRQFGEAMNRKDGGFMDAHPGLAAQKVLFQQLWAAFPDLVATPVTTLVSGDWVAARVSASGTMQGAFLGINPTGKHATWEVIGMSRVADGKIVEYHAQSDIMGMLQQLGAGPTGVATRCQTGA